MTYVGPSLSWAPMPTQGLEHERTKPCWCISRQWCNKHRESNVSLFTLQCSMASNAADFMRPTTQANRFRTVAPPLAKKVLLLCAPSFLITRTFLCNTFLRISYASLRLTNHPRRSCMFVERMLLTTLSSFQDCFRRCGWSSNQRVANGRPR